jgi:hypothetical protein
MTTLALRSSLRPRIGRSRDFSRPWSASTRLLAYYSVRCHVSHAEIAARDGHPRRRHVALDQLTYPARLQERNGRTTSKTTRTHRGLRARWRSFTSLLAITTRWLHRPSGTTPAPSAPCRPCGRSSTTAGDGASSSDRSRSTQVWLTAGSVVESNLLGGKGIHEGLTDRQIRRLCCVGWQASHLRPSDL